MADVEKASELNRLCDMMSDEVEILTNGLGCRRMGEPEHAAAAPIWVVDNPDNQVKYVEYLLS